MTTPTDRGPDTATPTRRTWWLAGRTVPAVVATTLGFCSFSSAMIGMSVRNVRADGRMTGISTFFIWTFVSILVLFLISAAASIVALRRHPELVRWPANPLPPDRARRWWIIGSALALIGVSGMVIVAAGGGRALWWLPFPAAIAGQWVFLMLARRTGQRGPVATNEPPSTT